MLFLAVSHNVITTVTASREAIMVTKDWSISMVIRHIMAVNLKTHPVAEWRKCE